MVWKGRSDTSEISRSIYLGGTGGAADILSAAPFVIWDWSGCLPDARGPAGGS